MMIDTKKTWWMLGLLGVLAAAIPVLAILQYQWIGAVSDGERARMRRTVQAGVLRFVNDFDRPLERAHEAFLLGAYPASETFAAHLVHRYRRWQAETRYPDLLEAVYWIDCGADEEPTLHRLDTAAVALIPQPWPDTLRSWHAFFSESTLSAISPAGLVAPEAPSTPPGLSIPLLSVPAVEDGATAPQPSATSSYLLLLLNQTYIARTVFPALARTYFLDAEEETTYDVLIHRRDDPERVVYRSHPALTAADFDTPDLIADLGLTSRINVTMYLDDDEEGTRVTMHKQDSLGMDVAVEMTRSAETILYEQDEDIVHEDVVRAPSVRGRLVAPGRPVGRRLDRGSGPVRPWRLLVRHKAGSIDAAIGSMRRRTLGIGFGILLVLGGAAALLFVSARRARRLGEQQMAFVAGVTHELRTPLAVIRSAAENLADGVITDPEQARRYGTLIHQEGRRLSEIVEQALMLAGAQSNHVALDLRPVTLRPLVEQALARCRPTLDEQDVTVTLDLADGLPPVYADVRTLEAAVCNLLTNACKYGGPRAQITLEAKPEPHGTPPTVRLTVRDHGPGIPNDELPHLFEPFYRGRTARQAQIRGSGLGLGLVKNTIEAQGGRVTVESAPGRGSAFTLHLPVAS